MRVRMVSEMFIKGKNSFDAELIYQGKTGAVCKAQSPIFKFSEYCLSGGFDILVYSQNIYMALSHLVHELNGSGMAAAHFKKGIGFVQNIVRGVNNSLVLLKLGIDSFGIGIILVFRNSKGAEGSGINKNLQHGTSPYRYLS